MPSHPAIQTLIVTIEQAIAAPASANLRLLLEAMEQTLDALPEAQQLRVAGDILARLIDLYAFRAEQLLEEWEARHRPAQGEPILTAAMLQEVLRQTMTLNLDEVMESSGFQTEPFQPTESLVSEVDKENLLEFLNQAEAQQAKQAALTLAYDENVSAWAAAIAQWMQQQSVATAPLLDIQRGTRLPLIKVWLALLLSGYRLEQRGGFYQTEQVWVEQAG